MDNDPTLFGKGRYCSTPEVIEYYYDLGAVVIDTESTGGSVIDEVIEIGIVRAKDGELLYHSRVKPSITKMNYYAQKVHGITMEELVDEPILTDIWDDIAPILAEFPVFAYNHTADKRFIKQSVDAYSIELPDIKWQCIMKAYSEYTNRPHGINLTQACRELDIEAGSHTAVSDALAAARVLYRMWQKYIPDIYTDDDDYLSI